MPLTAAMFLIVCPLALLAGFVDAVAGGGGLISLPAYYLAGLPASTAAGTNKLSATMGTMLAVYQYGKSGKIERRIGLFSGIAAAAASALGVLLMKQLPDHTVRVLVMCCIPVAALFTLRGHGRGHGDKRFTARVTMLLAVGIGCAVGFYDGLVGPGTGTFLILLFVFPLSACSHKSSAPVSADTMPDMEELLAYSQSHSQPAFDRGCIVAAGLASRAVRHDRGPAGEPSYAEEGQPVCARDDAVRAFPASCQNDYGYVTIKVAMNLEVGPDDSTRSFTRGTAYHSRTSGLCPRCQHDALRAGHGGRAGHGPAGRSAHSDL